MTKKQLSKMVSYEGLIYAGISLLSLALPGSLLIYGLFYAFRQWVDYAVITYPWLPFIVIAIALLFMCAAIPVYFIGQVTKGSVADRINAADCISLLKKKWAPGERPSPHVMVSSPGLHRAAYIKYKKSVRMQFHCALA
jgi:hypothetical protein